MPPPWSPSMGDQRRAKPRRRKAPPGSRLAVVLLLLLFCKLSNGNPLAARKIEEESVEVEEVEGVAGRVVNLRCDMHTDEDIVTLVIWFKDGVPSPVYTFDARGKATLSQGKHWSDERMLGGRAFFRFQEHPSWLTVDHLKAEDAGTYRCRVDYRHMRTRNTRVNLTVLVPPEKLIIMDDNGVELPGTDVVLGPRNEGSSVNITCTAIGGHPTPRVTWWQANALLDDQFVFDNTTNPARVHNVLRLDRLDRRLLHMVFTCQALNNNVTVPLSATVTVDLNLPPLWVRLLGYNRPLSADNVYEIKCEAIGTRPTAEISWWKGGVPLRNIIDVQTSPDGNRTVSTLKFEPTMEDGGKLLSCRGGTPLIPVVTLEDAWKLDVYHVPIVNLELGANLNASNIREGIDVYFECNIKSNPWVYKVSWRHNGVTLNSNTSAGTFVSNQSLVLQSVSRSRSGLYTCVGSNHEGDGESNPVFLDVKFIPVCKVSQQRAYGVARGEPARILCELDANPTDVHFTWKFNNTSDTVDLPASLVTADRARSVATYTPMTELDYGSLLCWGRNSLGMQQDPCIFQISPAGKPDPLHNCTILNQTAQSLHVECTEGFDGGLHQHFIMDVFDADAHSLVRHVNSSSPVFSVTGLRSGLGFDINVYAANVKGRSDPLSLHAYTLKAAEKRTASPALLNITPVLGILIGGVAALVLVAIIIVVVMRLRGRSGEDTKQRDGTGTEGNSDNRTVDKSSSEPLSKDTDDSNDSQEEKNPDIIPQNNDTDYQDPDEKAFEKLNNAPNRIYAGISPHIRSQSPRIYDNSGNVMNVAKPRDEVTYAELSLPKQQPLYVGVPHTPAGVRRQEPTVYAQIDVCKPMTPQQHVTRQLPPQQHPPKQHASQQTPLQQHPLQQLPPHQLTPQHSLQQAPHHPSQNPPQHVHQHTLQHAPHHGQQQFQHHTLPRPLQHSQPHLQQHPQHLHQRPQQQPQQHSHQHSDVTQPQTLDGNTASASLPLLHHHNLTAAYTPHPHQPTLRLLAPPGPAGQRSAMTALRPLGPYPPDEEMPACAETPLLAAPSQLESTV